MNDKVSSTRRSLRIAQYVVGLLAISIFGSAHAGFTKYYRAKSPGSWYMPEGEEVPLYIADKETVWHVEKVSPWRGKALKWDTALPCHKTPGGGKCSLTATKMESWSYSETVGFKIDPFSFIPGVKDLKDAPFLNWIKGLKGEVSAQWTKTHTVGQSYSQSKEVGPGYWGRTIYVQPWRMETGTVYHAHQLKGCQPDIEDPVWLKCEYDWKWGPITKFNVRKNREGFWYYRIWPFSKAEPTGDFGTSILK